MSNENEDVIAHDKIVLKGRNLYNPQRKLGVATVRIKT